MQEQKLTYAVRRTTPHKQEARTDYIYCTKQQDLPGLKMTMAKVII